MIHTRVRASQACIYSECLLWHKCHILQKKKKWMHLQFIFTNESCQDYNCNFWCSHYHLDHLNNRTVTWSQLWTLPLFSGFAQSHFRIMSDLLCVWLMFNSRDHHKQGAVSIRVDIYTPHTHTCLTRLLPGEAPLCLFLSFFWHENLQSCFFRGYFLINVQHEEEAVVHL